MPLVISGTLMRPIAAAVAVLDPDAAAKPAQAKFAATASPPGRPPSHNRAALNSAVEIPELCATEPISRNIGIAENDQCAAKSNGSVRSMPPATLQPLSAATPNMDTIISANPTGTRNAISTSRAPSPENPI